MKNIFDTHAHYDNEAFGHDRSDVLSSMPSMGVCAIVNCGCDVASSRASVALASEYPFIYAACGVHPHDCADYKGSPDTLYEVFHALWKSENCVAIGEIGLDYHYDFSPRELQKAFFEEQVRLSLELNLPVIVHDREAHGDTLEILKKYRPAGVMHCFSGGVELAREVVNMGMYVGLGGAATFKNARKPLEVAALLPEDRLLLETDCPYMTPVPFRGKRNDSSLIPYTAQAIAAVRGCSAQELLDITAANACKLFSLNECF
jgi:TatD DNase family protein